MIEQLDADIPTFVPVVTDAAGAPLLEVRVSVDGEVMAQRIDGRSIPVDPGLHEFSFSTEQGQTHSEKVLIPEGQRNRLIEVRLGPEKSDQVPPLVAPTPPNASSESAPPAQATAGTVQKTNAAASSSVAAGRGAAGPSRSIWPYVIGGAGLAAVGSSFLIAHWGEDDNDRLDACAPNCSQASVDHVSHMYLAADITLGAGIVGLGVATWLFLTEPSTERPPSDQAYRFELNPTTSGVFARVGRSF